MLSEASVVYSSELTLVECGRALVRGVATGAFPETEASVRQRRLDAAARGWDRVRLTARILDRARRPFPREPIRTLDAIHLAAALAVLPEAQDSQILTLDDSVRANAALLGFKVVPEENRPAARRR
jgi:predicted nucleic acid-binding protein